MTSWNWKARSADDSGRKLQVILRVRRLALGGELGGPKKLAYVGG